MTTPEPGKTESVPPPLPLNDPPRMTSSCFWPVFWMGVALAGCKFVHVGPPYGWSWWALRSWVTDLVIVSHADVFYAIVVGLIAQVALALASPWPKIQRSVWILAVAFCAVSVFYALLSVRIFWFLRMPLTYPLIYLAGDMRNMQSSIAAFLTRGLIVSLVALPLAYLGVVLATARVQPKRTANLRFAQALLLIGAFTIVMFAHKSARGEWRSRHDDRRIAENPHYVLLASWLKEVTGGQAIVLNEPFPPECLQDFLLVSERPGGAPPTPGLSRGPKNVILVVLESVATQHLSVYGSPYKTTPRLEAELGNCLVFDSVYSHFTNTANALASILLSIYPPMTWREYTVERPDLPGTTIPQVLRPMGYRTAFISAGDNTYANQLNFLQNRGFDVIWDYRDSGAPKLFSWGVEDRCVVDMTLRFIEQDRSRPFFVMVWTQATHNPYPPLPGQTDIDFLKARPAPIRQTPAAAWNLNRYLNALVEMDWQMGRLFEELRKRGLADDTIVLITGDHGEVFGYPHESWGHSGKVYQEDVNIPCILWSPRLFARQEEHRRSIIGAHIDLSPTVLDLLNLPCPGDWQGRSLFSNGRPPRAYMYGAMEDLLLSVREHNYKYILNATIGREELYDVGRDPTEQHNLAPGDPKFCRYLRQRVAAWVDYQKKHAR